MTRAGSSTSVAPAAGWPKMMRRYSEPWLVVWRSASTPSKSAPAVCACRLGLSGRSLPAGGQKGRGSNDSGAAHLFGRSPSEVPQRAGLWEEPEALKP